MAEDLRKEVLSVLKDHFEGALQLFKILQEGVYFKGIITRMGWSCVLNYL